MRRKSDILTPLGLIVSIGLILWACISGGSSIKIFYDFPSILITVIGSLGAIVITYPIEDVKLIPKALKYSFTNGDSSKVELLNQFKMLSRKARRDGLLALDDDLQSIDNSFLRKGLELSIDGVEQEVVKEILENEIAEYESSTGKYSEMFKIWGSYAPAFGMMGTLVGLIQMLSDLTSPDMIAAGMGKALITTFYGSFMSSIVLNPIGYNIEAKLATEVNTMEMITDGIISIQLGDSSRILEGKLLSYLSNDEKVEYFRELKSSGSNSFVEGATGNVS
ncbi:motility protein A [Metaclostridioides mangenotii]|uniref:Chemotaxis protein MotA n=1 Tax=Metaclostridioides mangenotii TaxID=1540 RepID=A0ABS4ECH7_9FIRM|nr:MotA/TolQ/ExbB proton channel family protein [Clostridioides mangenotii]MBP1855645.1 chemotaxis protein MotA [Clostridioides mangenotii]